MAKGLTARGLAVGDFDNDGKLDVLIAHNAGARVLLHNQTNEGTHWPGLPLVGTRCSRDGIGTRISWSAGGVTRSRLKTSGGSYLSSHDPREILGLGTARKPDWVKIEWPNGTTVRHTTLLANRYNTITPE